MRVQPGFSLSSAATSSSSALKSRPAASAASPAPAADSLVAACGSFGTSLSPGDAGGVEFAAGVSAVVRAAVSVAAAGGPGTSGAGPGAEPPTRERTA